MSKFYLEEPSLKRKEEAIEYIKEHFEHNSNINGSGGLDEGYLNYEDWLAKNKLKKLPETCPDNKCPGYSFFLIREEDSKVIGMISIRYNLNDDMLHHGGHIGYGIRPTERSKGYNKINLYLGLLKSKEIGLENVLLTANDNNPASCKTILSLGGILENKILDDNGLEIGRYWINVEDSLTRFYEVYKDNIIEEYSTNNVILGAKQ